MSYKGTKGGPPGGKEGKPPKAALRHLASFVWNAWHRPVSADFGLTFGGPLGPFVLILAPFWLILGPFWSHLGPDLGYFAPSEVSFWFVLGEIQFLRQKFIKKHSCIDPGIKFLANFRMQTIFPGPGGGTIAAGNRDSPPGRVRPTAGACWDWVTVCVFPSQHAPFPRSRSGFCNILFFF